jgi:UPF0716 family protein affecting phage T7 exclusion
MFFLILPFFLAEILIFTTFTHFFDFWEVLPFYFLPSLLGAIILSRTGRGLVMALQKGTAAGQVPGKAVLHQVAKVVGAICLLIPFFLPRVFAIFLIVPGLRHLSVQLMKSYAQKKAAKGGSFSFVRFGMGNGGPFRTSSGGPFGSTSGGPFGRQGPFGHTSFEDIREERDATVVDITPLEITHSPSVGTPRKEE